MLELLLTIDGVTKSFSRSENLFEPIDLLIQKQDAIFITGANGAGKSTLMQIIAGIEHPSSGKVLRAKSKLKISYLPQLAPQTLLPFQTQEVIAGLQRNHSLTPLQQEYLEKFELKDHLKTSYRHLSLGQKRKVLILRSLLEADLYLFDEPFASLDRSAQSVLLELLREMKSRNMTFVSIVHEHHLNLDFFNKKISMRKCCL